MFPRYEGVMAAIVFPCLRGSERPYFLDQKTLLHIHLSACFLLMLSFCSFSGGRRHPLCMHSKWMGDKGELGPISGLDD